MNGYQPRLYLDKVNGKWTGLCAGLADSAGIPVMVVRCGMVMLAFGAFPVVLMAYFGASFMLPVKPAAPKRDFFAPQLQPGTVARLAIELNDQGQAVLVPQLADPQMGDYATTTPAPRHTLATARLKSQALARYDDVQARMNAVETYIMNANLSLSAQIDRLPLQNGVRVSSPQPAPAIDDLLEFQQVQALARTGPPRTFGRAAPRA